MKIKMWLKPGMKLKRWALLAIIGIIGISFGISFLFGEKSYSINIYTMSIAFIASGIALIYVAVSFILKNFYKLLSIGGFKGSLDFEKINEIVFKQKLLIKGPRIVVIGGGTGISTMLRGLKKLSSNLTAVVTVADDGGGSGMLREDLGMLPPGDIRNCILALADTEPVLERLLEYRFKDGTLKGQCFGNLFLAAMDGISENFQEAVKKVSDVLAVTGRVLPVTLDDVALRAELESGRNIIGESKIGDRGCDAQDKILKINLEPENVEPLQEVLDALIESDIIILGPGSLYTSVLPNLLVQGVQDAIKCSKALKVYVCNVMTQPGETDGKRVSDHIKAIEEHSYDGIVDYCLVNNTIISDELKEKYALEGASQVDIDTKRLEGMGVKCVAGDFLTVIDGLVRHDADKLAKKILSLNR